MENVAADFQHRLLFLFPWTNRPTAFVVGRGVDLETAVSVKDLALRMGNAAVYKEGGIAGEDYPNHLKLTDVDEASEHGSC